MKLRDLPTLPLALLYVLLVVCERDATVRRAAIGAAALLALALAWFLLAPR